MRASPLAALLLAGTGSLASCGTPRQNPEGAPFCAECHGDANRAEALVLGKAAPPVDVSGASTGIRVGAHQTHLHDGQVARAVACAECHEVPVDLAHVDGTRGVAFATEAGTVAAADGATPTFTAGAAGAAGTCAGVYCHGATRTGGVADKTLRWDAPPGTVAGCGWCHGFPPPAPHAQVAADVAACAGCHPATARPDGSIDTATHVDGVLDVVALTCTSCHGTAGRTGLAGADANLAAAPPLGTGGETAVTQVAVGAHQAHVDQATFRSAPLPCSECHAGFVPTAIPHSDGVANVAGGPLATSTALGTSPSIQWSAAGPGTCASTYCHGNFRGGNGTTAVTWAQDVTLTCTSCHPAPPTSGGHPTVASTTDCGTCHAGYSGTSGTPASLAVNKAIHVDGSVQATGGGDCVACHDQVQNGRRVVTAEFARTWSHKRSGGRTVTKEDCIVCHMEGDAATGGTTGVHMDGFVNLRDPDTGLHIKGVTYAAAVNGTPGSYSSTATDMSFANFGRNLASSALEPAVQAVMVNHCLKCHDANGAASASARVPGTGTAEKPFGTTISGAGYTGAGITANGVLGGVVNVAASFAPSNASYHPVLSQQNNTYVPNTRMQAPWNTLSPAKTPGTTNATNAWGFRISCWDCHAPLGTASTATLTETVTAHGGTTTLRQSVWLTSTADNLCLVCHTTAIGSTQTHGTGSAWSTTGRAEPGSLARNACFNCHSSSIAKPARPIAAQDVHGFNAFAPAAGTDTMWPVGTTNTYRPFAFFRSILATGGRWTSTVWKPLSGPGVPTGSATCGGQGSLGPGCNDDHSPYTPGGVY